MTTNETEIAYEYMKFFVNKFIRAFVDIEDLFIGIDYKGTYS